MLTVARRQEPGAESQTISPWLVLRLEWPNTEDNRMSNRLPYVAAALICEKVLQETNGSISIIRLADRVDITKPPDFPAGVKPMIQLNGFVSLKSGDTKGDFTLTIEGTNP